MAEPRPYSLAARLAVVTAIWSACALLITGLVLAHLFRRDAERDFDQRIEADLIHLIRVTTSDLPQEVTMPRQLSLPETPLGPQFSQPFSGWAWQVRRGGEVLAQSGSLGPLIAGVAEPLTPPGEMPQDFVAPGGIASRGAARAVIVPGKAEPMRFAVARPRAEIDDSLGYFSRLQLYALGVFGAVMFGASLVLTRVMLVPVTRLETAVREVRDGKRSALDRRWPKEIAPVITALRDLDAHLTRLVERSRNQTTDLAHALKTPLTIIRQAVERGETDGIDRELDRIGRSLDWHLTRRRLSGAQLSRIEVAGVVEDVVFAMERLFADRDLRIAAHVAEGAEFLGDAEDLHEILGNLIENACKWAQSQVRISVDENAQGLTIRVEDDGPGVPEEVADQVFRRGARLDETVPGHGHGLAIVWDIAELYGGKVTVERAPLGGAEVSLTLPASAPRDARGR
ncbi:MAG: sensor histidine kinase [Paracoccaceae bacterium]|nr:sensor histidine kinase [Paracoccaceae bacterium]